jgi:tripartite-type tricarboxylate transporter receptor subunit TctC
MSFTSHPCLLRRRQALALALVAAALPMPALAAYPDKSLRLIVPFPPGGAADAIARGMANKMAADLGQQVIIENRGGAGGTMAVELAAKAAPDGYTLLLGTVGTHAINPALYPKLRYDPVKDFAPITLTHSLPRVLVAGPSIKAQTVGELIALAKAKPGALTYGSAGNGSTGHLSGALFESMAGVDLLHIPYKGSAPLLTDVLSGLVDTTFDSLTVYENHIKSGKVKALAVTSQTRLTALPEVPTLSESGLTGYEVSNWLGVLAPAGTPHDIVVKLNGVIARATADPVLRKQLQAQGIEPTFSTPEELAAKILSELPKWAAIVRKTGAKVE